ncbi:MAG: diguanylate cyclase, partial [Leptolyngbyaceae bacterium]|nr:diguanylate cyclase [Leptolyngbyaceae bacterium]
MFELTSSPIDCDRLLNSLIDGVLVTNAEGCILLANSAARIFLGWPKASLKGQLLTHLLLQPIPLESLCQCSNTFEGELFRDTEFTLSSAQDESVVGNCLSVDCVVMVTEQQQMFVYSIRDVTAINARREALTAEHQYLKQRHREITLLDELNTRLQTCLRVDEVYAIAQTILSAFFPDCSGIIYSLDERSGMLDCVSGWNDGLLLSTPIFKTCDCWALRLGKSYCFHDGHAQGISCHHLRSPSGSMSHMCKPLTAQGITHGLLYWGGFADGTLTPEVQSLIDTIAERIALAIANIKMRDQLEERSIRDQLTGVFNRRYLEEALEQLVHRANRQETSISIALLDIDHFKQFNDTYGHAAGDKVLREFSQLMSNQVRVCDLVCRYGGEEFVIVLPETSADIAQRRLSDLCSVIRQLRLQHAGKILPSITASVGLVSLVPKEHTALELLNIADQALYKAKHEGRDRIVLVENPLMR